MGENMSKNKTKKTIEVKKSSQKQNNKFEHFFENTLNILTLSSKYLLLFITIVLIFTSSLFIFNLEITKFHLPITIIISTIIFGLYYRKNLKKAILATIIGLIIFSAATFAVGKIYDSTADGNTYHKLTIGALKNGWNPVYEDIADFKNNPFDILEDNVNVKWSNHYANGTEQFAAVVYAFTNNIETGKAFNILWIYIGLFIFYDLFRQIKISKVKSLFLSITLAFNPISLTQVANLYLDGVLAISLFIIIIISIIKSLYKTESKDENNFILAMSIIWCVNAKFTGLAFAAIFSIILYLYRNIKNYLVDKKVFKEKLIKETIYYLIVVVISVAVVGSSTYTKNFIQHGHPLFPLYGKNHVDNMVMMEMPSSMQEYSSLRIFLTSIFAKGENVSPSYATTQNDPDLKVPLTFTKEEIENYNIPDIRMGGFGPLFSAIFIFSFISLIIIGIKLKKDKEYEKIIVYGLVILTTIILVLALDGSYWARYIPYVYLLPIYSLIYILKKDYKKNKLANIVSSLIIAIFIFNSLLISYSQYISIKSTNEYIKIRIERLQNYYKENNKLTIKLNHHGVQGVQYNLDDLNIKNYVLTDTEKNNEGYMFNY